MPESRRKFFNKMKDDLENWREILLIFYDLSQWKLPHSLVIISSTVSVFYLLLWWLDWTIITQFSIFLLLCILINFFYPTVVTVFFKPEKWTGIQEKQLEIVIYKILDMSESATECWNTIFWDKNKSMSHLFNVSGALLGLAWIGASINNLLLIYLITMIVCLWPGLSQLKGFQAKVNMIKSKIFFNNSHANTKML